MIDVGKEFTNIAFQNPRGSCSIVGDLAGGFSKAVYRAMGAFFKAAGIKTNDDPNKL